MHLNSFHTEQCKQFGIMIKKFHHYFIPVFIVIYFLLAFTPIIFYQKSEIFPFFSFKLYSKVPNDFIKYDLLYNKGEADEYFLLYKNSALNKLERKNFNFRVNLLGKNYEQSKKLFLKKYSDLISREDSVFLVKISGNYVKAIRDDKYNIEVICKLK